MIDQSAVSRLIIALLSLKDSRFGKNFDVYEKLWENEIIDSLKNRGHWSASPEVVSEAESTLRDLENVKTVLACLSSSLEVAITDVKETIRPFKLGKGLSSIPAELLSKIFEHTVEETGYSHTTSTKDKSNLSFVCRRFRRVALNTPRLWSHVSSNSTMPHVRTCLERSKSVGITIMLSVDSDWQIRHMLSFLAAVIPHSTRWEHFQARFSSLNFTNQLEVLRLHFLSNLHLPSLRSLDLEFPFSVDLNTTHFYQSWDMPNLRSLTIDIIPKSFVAPKLSFARFSSLCISSAVEIELFQDFLSTFPNLEELDIEFYGNAARDYPHSPQTLLPNLTALRIGISKCNNSRHVRPFMVALQVPKLRDLEIEMSIIQSGSDFEMPLDDFFPHTDYPALGNLSLKMHESQQATLAIPFGKFRGLRSLSLDTPRFIPDIPWSYEEDDELVEFVPALRKLKIAKCQDVHLKWMEEFRNSLIEQGDWAAFKQLEVSSALSPSTEHRIRTLYGEEDKDVIWRKEIN